MTWSATDPPDRIQALKSYSDRIWADEFYPPPVWPQDVAANQNLTAQAGSAAGELPSPVCFAAAPLEVDA